MPAEQAFAAAAEGLSRVALELRGRGLTWEAVWVLETSEAGRAHVHLLQHGSGVSSKLLAAASHRAGLGKAWIQAIRKPRTIVRYVLKRPLSALDEPARATEILADHLSLNGARLVHWTRGFWRDSDGLPLLGIRAARRAALLSRGNLGGGSNP
jgi:hypothetical protein